MNSKLNLGNCCPICEKEGNNYTLRYFYINLEEKILKCENRNCLYPYYDEVSSDSETEEILESSTRNDNDEEEMAWLDEILEAELSTPNNHNEPVLNDEEVNNVEQSKKIFDMPLINEGISNVEPTHFSNVAVNNNVRKIKSPIKIQSVETIMPAKTIAKTDSALDEHISKYFHEPVSPPKKILPHLKRRRLNSMTPEKKETQHTGASKHIKTMLTLLKKKQNNGN